MKLLSWRRNGCAVVCTALCLSVVCFCFFLLLLPLFFFNFGCERYLMYQKQFVQTLFYQLKVRTPCWGLLYLTDADNFHAVFLRLHFTVEGITHSMLCWKWDPSHSGPQSALSMWTTSSISWSTKASSSCYLLVANLGWCDGWCL
jgi:hypothetical protein